MTKRVSITRTRKRGRGRPPTGAKSIHLRVEPPLLAALDKFIADNHRDISRPTAIRELLEYKLVGLGHLKIADTNR